jgi:hypothetical protein
MGQAKQRGTFEERKALAVQQAEREQEQIKRRDAERKKIGGDVQRRLENEVVLKVSAHKSFSARVGSSHLAQVVAAGLVEWGLNQKEKP